MCMYLNSIFSGWLLEGCWIVARILLNRFWIFFFTVSEILLDCCWTAARLLVDCYRTVAGLSKFVWGIKIY